MRVGLAPLLTEEWDNDCDYENILIGQIRRSGYISTHPDGWGAHDNPFEPRGGIKDSARLRLLIAADRVERKISILYRKREKIKRAKARQRLRALRQLNTGNNLISRINAYDGFDYGFDQRTRDEAFELLETFPHTNNLISNQVAREFVVTGYNDACDRKIDNVTWLWERSRRLNLELAGLK